MNPLVFIILALGGSAVFGSVKIVNEKNQYLVESLGSYKKTLEPGLNFVTPFIDKIVYRETIREKVLDVPPNLASPVTTFPLAWMRWFTGALSICTKPITR